MDIPIRRGPLVVLESLGLALSLVLVGVHFGWIAQESVPCPRGSIFACSSILKGPWSAVYGVPWAVLGAVYFAGHLLLTAGGACTATVRWLKVAGVLSGIFVVMGLRAVELVHLRKICPMCWGVAVVTLAQAAAAWNWWPGLASWPVWARLGAVLTVSMAALGVVLTVLLLRVDVRRSGGGVVTTFVAEPADTAGSGAVTTGTVIAQVVMEPKPDRAAVVHFTQPLGSPIEGPEVELIRSRGWTVTANPGVVQEALARMAPVLLFAYDPLCEECHATMKEGLTAQDWPTTLVVTRVAVEESALPPEVTGEVRRSPTLLLLDSRGQVLWRHEGRISFENLVRGVESGLR
jgi:uncharacterized membrane protein